MSWRFYYTWAHKRSSSHLGAYLEDSVRPLRPQRTSRPIVPSGYANPDLPHSSCRPPAEDKNIRLPSKVLRDNPLYYCHIAR